MARHFLLFCRQSGLRSGHIGTFLVYEEIFEIAAQAGGGGIGEAGTRRGAPQQAPPAIPASAEAALAELKKAAEMSGDAGLRRVCVERAQQAVGIEMIKAIRSRAPMSDPRMSLKIF
jgi:hypothetical protein